MSPLQLTVLLAFTVVVVYFIASLFGHGDIPVLRQVVTVILSVFVAYELLTLTRVLWEKFA
ncbi:MAG: hypothetical protein ACFB4I_19885 [Cyanophyceae cyanobacterium]